MSFVGNLLQVAIIWSYVDAIGHFVYKNAIGSSFGSGLNVVKIRLQISGNSPATVLSYPPSIYSKYLIPADINLTNISIASPWACRTVTDNRIADER